MFIDTVGETMATIGTIPSRGKPKPLPCTRQSCVIISRVNPRPPTATLATFPPSTEMTGSTPNRRIDLFRRCDFGPRGTPGSGQLGPETNSSTTPKPTRKDRVQGKGDPALKAKPSPNAGSSP